MNDLENNVRQFCRNARLRLNHGLGQNFLINQSTLDSIVKRANIQKEDHIVEIGPGIGVLTTELRKITRNITAIEIDENLIPILHRYLIFELGAESDVNVIQGNALDVSMPDHPYKIVANIPYHITSPLLRHVFLESSTMPTSLTLLIQKEVAKRICNETDASMLSIIVKLFGKPSYVLDVPPTCFLPAPKVHSAVIHIECFSKPIAPPKTIETIFALTKMAFTQKRKMLRNTLQSYSGAIEALNALDIDVQRRPQTLSIDEWIKLAEKVQK